MVPGTIFATEFRHRRRSTLPSMRTGKASYRVLRIGLLQRE